MNLAASLFSTLMLGVLLTVPASANSILGDTFTIEFSCADCMNNGPMDHVAVLPGPTFRIFDEREYSARQDEINVQWIDEDTFAFIADPNEPVEDDIVLILTGLDFADGGTPHDISGVSANGSLTDCPAEFFNCPDVVGPDVEFTANSITVRYAQSTGLRADAPVWAFDVSTLPEPGLATLGLGGLLALALRRRAGSR